MRRRLGRPRAVAGPWGRVDLIPATLGALRVFQIALLLANFVVAAASCILNAPLLPRDPIGGVALRRLQIGLLLANVLSRPIVGPLHVVLSAVHALGASAHERQARGDGQYINDLSHDEPRLSLLVAVVVKRHFP